MKINSKVDRTLTGMFMQKGEAKYDAASNKTWNRYRWDMKNGKKPFFAFDKTRILDLITHALDRQLNITRPIGSPSGKEIKPIVTPSNSWRYKISKRCKLLTLYNLRFARQSCIRCGTAKTLISNKTEMCNKCNAQLYLRRFAKSPISIDTYNLDIIQIETHRLAADVETMSNLTSP